VEQAKVDANKQDDYGRTVLHLAVINNALDVVEYLAKIPEIARSVPDEEGKTALSLAVQAGQMNIVQCLMKDHLSFLSNTRNEERKLIDALFWNRDSVLNKRDYFKYLSEKSIININTLDSHGKTLLHLAAGYGSLDFFQYLLAAGKININARDNDGRTVLHSVMLSSIPSTHRVENLIAKKVGLNIQDKNGETALHLAIRQGKLKIADYLIELSEFARNTKDNNGQTALHLAARNGCLDVVKKLIKDTTSDIILKTNDGQTLLLLAVLGNHLDTVKFFIEMKRFDMKSTDKYGNTILHSAFQSSFEVMKYLLETQHFEIDLLNNSEQYLIKTFSKQLDEIFEIKSKIEMINHLIKNANIDLNALNSEG
jgi:ankyrin repeat protein